MPIIDGTKLACGACIRGHRSTSCQHTDRPLFEVRKKGRPMTQCNHCRDLRKVKQVHVRCHCKPDPSDAPKRPVTGKKKVTVSGVANSQDDACNCDATGVCTCATPRSTASKHKSPSPGSATPSTSKSIRPEHCSTCGGHSKSPSYYSGTDRVSSSSSGGSPSSSCCGNGVASSTSSPPSGGCCQQPANPTNPAILAGPVITTPAATTSTSTNSRPGSSRLPSPNSTMNSDYCLAGPSPFSPPDNSWTDSNIIPKNRAARYTPYPQHYVPITPLGATKDVSFPPQPAYNQPTQPLQSNVNNLYDAQSIELWNQVLNNNPSSGDLQTQNLPPPPSMPPPPPPQQPSHAALSTNTNINGTECTLCPSGCSCEKCRKSDPTASSTYDCEQMLVVIRELCLEMAKRPIVDLPYPIRKPQPLQTYVGPTSSPVETRSGMDMGMGMSMGNMGMDFTSPPSVSTSISTSLLSRTDANTLSQLEQNLGISTSTVPTVSTDSTLPATSSNCSCGPDCNCLICSGNKKFNLDEWDKPCHACQSCADCVSIREVVASTSLDSTQFPSTYSNLA